MWIIPIHHLSISGLHWGRLRDNSSTYWTSSEFPLVPPPQVAASDALCSFGGSGVLTRHRVSLLEAIEGLGQAGSVEQDVEVAVQRVYSVPMADCSPVSILKHKPPHWSSTAPPPAEKRKTRYGWTFRLLMARQEVGGRFGLSPNAKRDQEKSFMFYLLCMLCHNINDCFCSSCMLVSWVSGLACMSLVARFVSVVRLLFTEQQAPQSAHTVSSHMALLDKGHKHF